MYSDVATQPTPRKKHAGAGTGGGLAHSLSSALSIARYSLPLALQLLVLVVAVWGGLAYAVREASLRGLLALPPLLLDASWSLAGPVQWLDLLQREGALLQLYLPAAVSCVAGAVTMAQLVILVRTHVPPLAPTPTLRRSSRLKARAPLPSISDPGAKAAGGVAFALRYGAQGLAGYALHTALASGWLAAHLRLTGAPPPDGESSAVSLSQLMMVPWVAAGVEAAVTVGVLLMSVLT